MGMKFKAEFDRVGLALSVASIIILFYMGIASPELAQQMWVAFGFWFVGFFYALIFCKRAKLFSFGSLFLTLVMIGLLLGVLSTINFVYASLEVVITGNVLSFAVGVAEELFFGIFLLDLLINRVGANPVVAILLSSGSHALYHIPNWGSDSSLMLVFFISFTAMRTVYVFFYPKVGILLGAHGIWNFMVGGA
jgi:hypothetical protein